MPSRRRVIREADTIASSTDHPAPMAYQATRRMRARASLDAPWTIWAKSSPEITARVGDCAFSEALHLELRSADSKVYIQALCPGYTYSEFHDTMGVDRNKLAPPALWMTAEQAVDASLRGWQQRKFLIIPGWRYRLLSLFVSQIPATWRIALESAAGRTRR